MLCVWHWIVLAVFPIHSARFIKGFSTCRLDANELDRVLSEVTLLNTRSELYLRFARRRIIVSSFILYHNLNLTYHVFANCNFFILLE